tara:strand:+ start:7792 stop:8523 length:732 start_codon:yes stop_codon:yes gene_type:complete
MPYYKKDKYIRDTINSILNQTFQNFEILIVDDELTEESNKVLKELKKVDGRIKVIENQKNLGAGLSRNKAIDFSKGSYLAFCDCDDLWERTKLNTQLNFMNELKIDFSYTSYEIINKDGKTIDYRNADQEITFNKLLRSCDIGLSTVIMKKNLFDQTNTKFPNLKTKEDFVLWLKLSKSGVRMMGLNKRLTFWRSLNNSLSSSSIQKLFDGYRVYRLYMKYSIFKSIIYLLILSLNFLFKKNK